jgi:hypothetical protein
LHLRASRVVFPTGYEARRHAMVCWYGGFPSPPVSCHSTVKLFSVRTQSRRKALNWETFWTGRPQTKGAQPNKHFPSGRLQDEGHSTINIFLVRTPSRRKAPNWEELCFQSSVTLPGVLEGQALPPRVLRRPRVSDVARFTSGPSTTTDRSSTAHYISYTHCA